MNIHCPLPVVSDPDWPRLRSEVSLWRGRMVGRFADVEHAVTEALVGLSTSNSAKRLPHLAGPRREALRLLLAGSAFVNSGKAALDALALFENTARRRVFLCHGRAQILVDEDNDWHVRLTVVGPADSCEEKIEWLVSRQESERFQADLNSSACRIIDRLRNLKAKTTAAT